MASPFSRTLRSLEADGHRRWALALVPAALLLAAWSAWFFAGRIAVYEVSADARLEAGREAHPIEAPVDGRISAVHVRLGQAVEAGEPLFAFEAGEQRYRLEEEEARAGALLGEIEALGREIAAAHRALADGRRAAAAAVAEAEARAAEAESAARLAAQEAARRERLHEGGLAPLAELEVARAAAEQRRAAATALAGAVARLRFEQQSAESDRRARLDALERDLARLRGEAATSGAAGRRLRRDLGLREIRAQVAGSIGELAPVRPGSVVEERTRLGAIVPRGGLMAVARFPPAAAAGRIRPGQRAQLRLAGFPATQYGTLAATVARVASEVRDGALRVELEVHPGRGSAVPLQHGMPGTVEVEVERVAPAVLVLRTVGKLLARPAAGDPRGAANVATPEQVPANAATPGQIPANAGRLDQAATPGSPRFGPGAGA